jgi:mercuric ion binding protein
MRSLLLLILFLPGILWAAQPNYTKTKTISIKTSAICGSCKKRLESGLSPLPGVVAVRLNLNNKKLSIKFDDQQTDPEKLKQAIAALGYQADEMPPRKEAYTQLPECCRKPGLCND